ncbi:transposase [Candidatus Kaiserbacteria bacterium]|nr:transposase [Candidatus Kaiserbacteria bacterium]
MVRIIGIRHRVKKTAENESRPTQVVILNERGDQIADYELADEQAELDFARGVFPVSFRVLRNDERITDIPVRHLKLKKLKAGQEAREDRIVRDGKDRSVAVKIADAFDGLKSGDRVAMILGGSGDCFALALARRGEDIGASVHRISPANLLDRRGDASKGQDAELLANLLIRDPDTFYPLRSRDAQIIRIREAFRSRIDVMKDRIACEQRLRQRLVGQIFCRPDGNFPEGAIEKMYDEAKANDLIYKTLCKEEAARERELEKVVEASGVWEHVLGHVEGMGSKIASRIIASVVDIRRMRSKEVFKAFAGVHVLPGGKFARRRNGQQSNWNPDVRQALYLLGDQMNRRPDSYWGQKLRANKTHFRRVHPETIIVDGVKRYNDMHIHNMALWRTFTQFAMWLYREWSRFERDPAGFKLDPYYPAQAVMESRRKAA